MTNLQPASGIGRMLARGCIVNGANVILIDVNQDALAEVTAELHGLASPAAPVVITRFVWLRIRKIISHF
jgi:short-subunit dehydrogenase